MICTCIAFVRCFANFVATYFVDAAIVATFACLFTNIPVANLIARALEIVCTRDLQVGFTTYRVDANLEFGAIVIAFASRARFAFVIDTYQSRRTICIF